jgi:hypothetical protein
MRVERYSDANKPAWDSFVRQSKNGTFLFCRDYMDYHRDRFQDHSLVIRGDDTAIVALLPANQKDDVLVSHGGLTYGGFITDEQMHAALMLNIFESTRSYLRGQGIRRWVYKAIPYIYHRLPAGEDEYALFRAGARLYRRDLTTVAMPSLRTAFQVRRLRGAKKARTAGVTIAFSENYAQFWPILEWNLATAHNLQPVHTINEIERLHTAFPEKIKLFAAFQAGQMEAGVVMYESPMVAHAQYTASSEQGRSVGALDLLFYFLLTEVYHDKPYFDFGVSTESEGQYLNRGLVEFKEGFGGRTVNYDCYEILVE